MGKLEQSILKALRESLGNSNTQIQEAKEDWITTPAQIATIKIFPPNDHPTINLYPFSMGMSGERKDYQSKLKKHINSNYFNKFKKQHFADLKTNPKSRNVLTRGKLINHLNEQSAALPKELQSKWHQEYTSKLAVINSRIEQVLDSIYISLTSHNKNCTRYSKKKCIYGSILDIAYKRSSPGNEERLEYALINPDAGPGQSRGPGELVKQLRSAIALAYRPEDYNQMQCSPAGVEDLYAVANLIGGDPNHEVDERSYTSLLMDRYGLSGDNWETPLTEEDFKVLENNPRVGAALVRAMGVKSMPPLVAARPRKLEHQIVWQIAQYSGQRKFDKDVDLCAVLTPTVEKIKNQDHYDQESFFQLNVARQLDSSYGYDKVEEAFYNVLENWDEVCKDFLAATRPIFRTNNDDLTIAGINPSYAIPGSEEHAEPADTAFVPRIDNDAGVGIGGEYGAQQPSVFDVYNSYIRDRLPKGYGFENEDFAWLIMLGNDESVLNSNPHGECPVCGGSGLINPETVTIPIAGSLDDEYWEVNLGKQDLEQAGGQRCSNCEGSGKTYPQRWQFQQEFKDGNEKFTPFESVFRELWDLLVSLGYNPVAYDGFVTYKNQLSQDEGYPIPAPRRPQVETQYKQNREGELNVISYTVLIRLDVSLGDDFKQVDDHVVGEFYPKLKKRLLSSRISTDLSVSNQRHEIDIRALRREPRPNLRRSDHALEYTATKEGENPDAVRESAWVSDIEEFEREYLKIKSDGIDNLAPSQRFLEELSKLISVANELEPYEFYDVVVPIYSFLDLENEQFKNRSRLIKNYDKLVKTGKEMSYGKLLDYCFGKVKLVSEKEGILETDLKHPDTYLGVLDELRLKAGLFDIESPEGSVDLDKVRDIGQELKLYLRFENQKKKLQRSTLFKAGVYGINEVSDISAIANRVNSVFKSVSKLHPKTGIPLNSKENPLFFLLIPFGYETKAEESAGIDDMKLVNKLILGDDEFGLDPKFGDSKARRQLARYYWKSQIEDKPMLEVLREEMSDSGEEAEYLEIKEMYPNYGIVDHLSKIFKNDNSEHPESALIEMFEKGVALTKKLYGDVGNDRLTELYKNFPKRDRKEELTPEYDLNRLDSFIKAARRKMQSPALRKKIQRANKKAKEYDPIVREMDLENRENREWKGKRNNFLADYGPGSDIDDVEEEDQRAYAEMIIYRDLVDVVRGASQLVPEYRQFAQLAKDYPVTFLRRIAPVFNPLFRKYDANVDVEHLFYPGLDGGESDLDRLLKIIESLHTKLGIDRKNKELIVRTPQRAQVAIFFRDLLENIKPTEEDPDASA